MKETRKKQSLLHITARTRKTDEVVDLYFSSITAARKRNPALKDFRMIGIATGTDAIATTEGRI